MEKEWVLEYDISKSLSVYHSLSMYHYEVYKEMQLDLSFNNKTICSNITVEDAIKIRDRLDEFIKFHSSPDTKPSMEVLLKDALNIAWTHLNRLDPVLANELCQETPALVEALGDKENDLR